MLKKRLTIVTLVVALLFVLLAGVAWYMQAHLRSALADAQSQGVNGNAALASAQDAMWKLRYGIS